MMVVENLVLGLLEDQENKQLNFSRILLNFFGKAVIRPKDNMVFSRVHHCIGQIKVAEERVEPPAPKCRCRKFLTLTQATEMVKKGDASWIVTKRTLVPAEKTCDLCAGNSEVKNCANCLGSGKVPSTQAIEDYGDDIVLVSQLPADKKEKKRKSALAAKTPRVATIERNHIELAYVYCVKEAQERIEEYGRLILDARMYAGKDRVFQMKPEPADNPKTGEGRNYDYGRSI